MRVYLRLSCAVLLLSPLALSAAPDSLTALPPVPVPNDNLQSPAKIELGKMLFFDPRLSGDGNELSIGYPGTAHWRNSQTILNAAYLNKFFWTGSAPTLEAQAKGAITGPLAQNMNPGLAEERLKQIPGYVKLFKEAFGGAPTFDSALAAIAAFERTVVSKNVPFDRYMHGDKKALDEVQVKGMALFQGKAGCVQCHNGPMLTDQDFHNLGVPPNKAFQQDPQRQIAMRERIKAKGIPESDYLALDRDPGHFLDTKKPEDKGKFRTPTLRELKYTGPYMHNGIFNSLDAVINFYDHGGDHDPFNTKSPLLNPLKLTTDEKISLRAFLESLSGDPILIAAPALPKYQTLPFPVKP